MYFIETIIVIGVVWSLWGYFTSRTEQTDYSVIEVKRDYEIRLYPPHIVAETTVQGPYKEALSQGFRIVAGYIFGGNTKKERIAMTAPVVEQPAHESIAITAPVMATIDGEYHTIAFGMPRSYTLETLPTPNDPRVKIVTLPEKKMAVLRFSGFRTTERILMKKQALINALKRDQIETLGEPQYAGYNAPWTPPWLMRNEVLIEIN